MQTQYDIDLLKKPKLILLDRDGVINQDSKDYVKTSSEWLPVRGSLEAISEAQRLGIKFGVCTNQSGLGRGLFSEGDLFQMHRKCNTILESLGGKPLVFFFCPHKPEDNCLCRKPKPLLIEQALSTFGMKSKEAIFIGDSDSDMRAAESATVRFVLVRNGNGLLTYQKSLKDNGFSPPSFSNLKEFLSVFHTQGTTSIKRQD